MPQTETVLPSSWHEVLARVQETLTRYAAAAEARARELEELGRAEFQPRAPTPPPQPSPTRGEGARRMEGVLRDAAGLEAALAEAQAGLEDWLAWSAEAGRKVATAGDTSLR
jgi:hypothetical protein